MNETQTTSSFPLTRGQQLLWNDVRPGGPRSNLNIGGLVMLPGKLDLARFHRAFVRVVKAHDALSLAFDQHPGGRLTQSSNPAQVPLLTVECLDQRSHTLNHRVECIMEAPLSLDAARLYRSHLFTMGEKKVAWVFVAHHLVADGFSLALFMNDVLYAYEDEKAYRPNIESFVSWAASTSTSQEARSVEYWQERLRGRVPRLFSTPPTSNRAKGRTLALPFSKERYEAMRSYGGGTPHRLLQAALGHVLSQHYQARDWVMALTTSNRRGKKQRRMCGQHAGVQPFPWHCTGEQSLKQSADEIGRQLLTDYRQLPFEGGERHAWAPMDADVAFNYYPFDFLIPEIDSEAVEFIPLGPARPMRALEVTLMDQGESRERVLYITYDPKVLSDDEAAKIREAMDALLDAAVSRPQESVATLLAELPPLFSLARAKAKAN